jgi:hypothetical protein
LANVTQVDFGMVPANMIRRISPSQITVTVPAHAPGTVHVVVYTTSGVSNAGPASQFTYQGAGGAPGPGTGSGTDEPPALEPLAALAATTGVSPAAPSPIPSPGSAPADMQANGGSLPPHGQAGLDDVVAALSGTDHGERWSGLRSMAQRPTDMDGLDWTWGGDGAATELF